jgi:hypothetical protein
MPARKPPCPYPDVRAIDAGHVFYPLKTFVVERALLKAFHPRVLQDGPEKKNEAVRNALDGPEHARTGAP